jgi:hypothetical protein
MAGIDDFTKPINEEPVLRRWAEATQKRNLDSRTPDMAGPTSGSVRVRATWGADLNMSAFSAR